MTMSLDSYGRSGARILWRGLRLPALLFLVLLEPVVTFVLWSLALLGLLMTLFYRAIGMPHFPFWTMLTISLLFAAASFVYQGLIRLLEALRCPWVHAPVNVEDLDGWARRRDNRFLPGVARARIGHRRGSWRRSD